MQKKTDRRVRKTKTQLRNGLCHAYEGEKCR